MQITKATQFKKVLLELDKQKEEAEKLSDRRKALKIVIEQVSVAEKNTLRFMTFPPSFYRKLRHLHAKLCRKYMWLVAGKSVDLERDLYYLGAKAQILKIQKKFWFN